MSQAEVTTGSSSGYRRLLHLAQALLDSSNVPAIVVPGASLWECREVRAKCQSTVITHAEKLLA